MIYLILVLGLLLRLISLNQSFWLDEATGLILARDFSFSDIVTKFSPGDFHPPFYYLMLKAWTGIFGLGEFSARAPSILFGVLTIFVVYKIGILVKSKVVGQIAALALATAPLHIYYSQEARMYSLETFLVSLAVLLFVKNLKAGRVGYWILLGGVFALIGMTDYLSLLIIPVFWVYALTKRLPRSWWAKFITSHIILFGAYIWWTPFFLKQFSSGVNVATSLPGWWNILGWSTFKEILLAPVKFMIGRVSFDNKLFYGFIVSVVGLLYGYLLRQALRVVPLKGSPLKVIWLWLIGPISIASLIAFKIPVFKYFRLIFVLPAFYLLVAIGLSKVKEQLFPLLLFGVLGINIVFSCMYLFNPKFHREYWRGLIQALGTRDKALVIFPAKSQREAFLYYGGRDKIIEPENLGPKQKEIWLLRYVQEITDPKDSVRQKIESLGYNKTSEENFNGVLVWKYIR